MATPAPKRTEHNANMCVTSKYCLMDIAVTEDHPSGEKP